jgi:S1-C subfamily serine protease
MITHANGTAVANGEELRKLIRKLRPGAELALKGYRGNQTQTWRVVVGEMPGADQLSR